MKLLFALVIAALGGGLMLKDLLFHGFLRPKTEAAKRWRKERRRWSSQRQWDRAFTARERAIKRFGPGSPEARYAEKRRELGEQLFTFAMSNELND